MLEKWAERRKAIHSYSRPAVRHVDMAAECYDALEKAHEAIRFALDAKIMADSVIKKLEQALETDEPTEHKPECWKSQALKGLGVGGPLASCTCREGDDDDQ